MPYHTRGAMNEFYGWGYKSEYECEWFGGYIREGGEGRGGID